jgi:hypothetical protein
MTFVTLARLDQGVKSYHPTSEELKMVCLLSVTADETVVEALEKWPNVIVFEVMGVYFVFGRTGIRVKPEKS